MAGATDSSPLLEEARSYRLSAAAARALAARMGPEPPWDQVRTAVSERDQTTAQLLMVAASVAGFRVPGALLRETVHLLDQSDLVLPFVGEAGGDPLALIEGLLEEPYLASQIGNDLCALSALILEGRPPPPSLLGAVRAWVFQQHLDPDGQLAEAVARLGDAELQAFVRARGFQTTSVSRGMLEFVRASWLMAPVSILEDHEALTPSPAVSTKIGRNEPCPCGSGKKFKKCCADKPSVPAIPRREPIPQGAISDVELVGLSDFECVRLRLEALSTSQRYMVFMRFLVRRWWKEARAVLEAVQRTRGSSPAEIAGLWADLARMALECGEETVARDAANQIAPEARSPELEARFEIRQPSPILDQLEALALSGLRAEDEDAVPEALHNLAFILLDHRPALGILVARAAIAPNRVFDSEVLLSDIDAARSNLGLSPGDRAEDIFDLFASGDSMESTDSSAHRAEAEAAKAQLATAAARARTLEAELDKQRRALEAERARPTETPAVDSAEVQRLRQKIADLKGLVSEHAAERGRLRSELKSLTASKPAAAPAAPMPTEPEAEPGVPSGAAERRRILTPVYAAAAEEALRAVPRHVASAALVLAANLAAGDEAAWVNTKVLAAVSELRSARVGIHHRLLFRVDASRGRLELVDLCSRSDLEKVLKRLGGS